MGKMYAYLYALIIVYCIFFQSCMEHGPLEEENFYVTGEGLFITNEGNFTYGNASLSYYDITNRKVENEIFIRANGINLGDVAQSMTIRNGLGYIVVNNSGVIFVIDVTTYEVVGSIKGLVSPRYIHFLSDTKAYVTDLYATGITIFNPQTFEITGYIDTDGHDSTEQMVQCGKYVFTNCWSYDNVILVIDSETDKVIDYIQTGIQPTSLVIDRNHKIWTVTDGGYEDSPYGYETPALYRIDAETREVEQIFKFKLGDSPRFVQLNGTKDTLYFINNSIWRMDVTDNRLPLRAFIEDKGTRFYGLAIDPHTSEVYVGDAIDYVQPGIIYRYTPQGIPTDTFKVGITPGGFCFR